MKLKKIFLFGVFFIGFIMLGTVSVDASKVYFVPTMTVESKEGNKNVAIIKLMDNSGIKSITIKEKVQSGFENYSVNMRKYNEKVSYFEIANLKKSRRYFEIKVTNNAGNEFVEYFNVRLGPKGVITDRAPRIYANDAKINQSGSAFVGNTKINIKDNGGISNLCIYDTSNKTKTELNQSEIIYQDDKKTTGEYILNVGDNEKRIYIISAKDTGKSGSNITERIVLHGKNYEEITLKKGASKQIDLREATKIKSSNPVVATIDENGIINAKQYGIAKITYMTAEKVKKTIVVYVKIGNKKIDMSVLKEKNTNILYQSRKILNKDRKVVKTYGTVMQFFDVTNGNTYYSSEDKKNSYINKYSEDGSNKGMMALNYFGHGQGISVDKNENVWVESIATKDGEYGYTGSIGISNFKFEKGKTYNQYGGKTYIYTKSSKVNYDNLKIKDLYVNMQPMIDEENGLFAVNRSGTVVIFDLETIKNNNNISEHKATISGLTIPEVNNEITISAYNLAEIKPLNVVPILNGYSKEINRDIFRGYHNQGIDIDGDYIYLYQGNGINTLLTEGCGGNGKDKCKNNLAFVTIFDMKYGKENGYKKASGVKNVVALKTGKALKKMSNIEKEYAEAEGIKVKNGNMYLGVYSKITQKGKNYRAGNILKYNK